MGSTKAVPFRGAMGPEAHACLSPDSTRPTSKGLVDSPDDTAECAGRKPDGKTMWMTALQRALSHADAHARGVGHMVAFKADKKGVS